MTKIPKLRTEANQQAEEEIRGRLLLRRSRVFSQPCSILLQKVRSLRDYALRMRFDAT
jgi:hypothetical protein